MMPKLRMPLILDAEMCAKDVLQRAAINGYWLDRNLPPALAHIQALADDAERDFDEVAKSLERDLHGCGAAIRRQWGTYVLWYARDLELVLQMCARAAPGTPLIDVLNLHEYQSDRTTDLSTAKAISAGRGIVLDAGVPVGVSLDEPAAASLPAYSSGTDPLAGSPVFRSASEKHFPAAASPASTPSTTENTPVAAWPLVDAPEWARAGEQFDVDIGFALKRQDGLSGGAIALPFTESTSELTLTIELSAGPDVESLDGWRQSLVVDRGDVEGARVRFRLVGSEPRDAEHPWLTTIEVRYVLDGTVCGVASRPLSILSASSSGAPDSRPFGTAWSATPTKESPIAFAPDGDAPDLTLEITKPDGNAASGRYQCTLLSPRALATALGPFDIDLGLDARTFAKQFADRVRSARGLLRKTLSSVGSLVAEKLPPQFFDALAEVAARTNPQPPAVLIVTTEVYVPWELASLPVPLDADRPNFLGAQAMVGKWMRNASAAAATSAKPLRPALHPPNAIDYERMAVMAAWYKATSGLRRLEKAEDEAKELAHKYAGLALPAKSELLSDLLDANLRDGFTPVKVQAVHFAGHGNYDPTLPDASTLFLEDGTEVDSLIFRETNYGGAHQPLLFLNACMLGIGGELLGDMAGFPGNSLRGGFGGVVGALWEVDDNDAYRFATQFWESVLPPAAGSGKPIGAVLRDMRVTYEADPAKPIPTFLAYVFYGHPRLTLRRAH